MSLKPFVVYMSLMQSLILMFVLDRVINAVCFNGLWDMAIIGSLFCLMMLVAFIMGVRDVRRAGSQETEPQPRTENIALFSSVSFAVMVVPLALRCTELLQDTRIPLWLKAVYITVASVFATGALSHLGYAWVRWQKAGCPRQLKAAVTNARPRLPLNRSNE